MKFFKKKDEEERPTFYVGKTDDYNEEPFEEDIKVGFKDFLAMTIAMAWAIIPFVLIGVVFTVILALVMFGF
ncbi:MAG: hypothetical protein ACK5LY_10275 [Lachnospirales bacterium]